MTGRKSRQGAAPQKPLQGQAVGGDILHPHDLLLPAVNRRPVKHRAAAFAPAGKEQPINYIRRPFLFFQSTQNSHLKRPTWKMSTPSQQYYKCVLILCTGRYHRYYSIPFWENRCAFCLRKQANFGCLGGIGQRLLHILGKACIFSRRVSNHVELPDGWFSRRHKFW